MRLPVPSVQLALMVHEAVLLIIRRPWVRVPPAPPAVISFIRCRSRTVSWTDVGGNVYSAATPSTPSGHAEQLPSGSWRAKAGICPPGRATSGICRCPAGFFHAAALFRMCEQIATAYLVTEATMARRISRPSGGSRGCRSTSPAISGRCCACSTSSSMRGTAETSTWRPRRSASPYRTLRRYSRSVDPP